MTSSTKALGPPRRRLALALALLFSVAVGLLDDHLKHCVVDAARLGGDEAFILVVCVGGDWNGGLVEW